MLVSSSKDGSICVWDAMDARIRSQQDDDEREQEDVPRRQAMWEIALNDGEEMDGKSKISNSDRYSKNQIGVTSVTAIQVGAFMAAATTDGSVRVWNVKSGLYEGAYNFGHHVQVWSLCTLSEQDNVREEECDEYGEVKIHSEAILLSGDQRGRIRVIRKLSSRVSIC